MIFLSHILNDKTPVYGNHGSLLLNRIKRIENGDSSNNTELSFHSHFGTHVDAPYHFDPKGQTLENYPASFWRCNNPYLIDYKASVEEIIGLDQIGVLLNTIPHDCDFLLLRTGFENYRRPGLDSKYIYHGPGLSPEVGLWLREYRQLKMIGFDFISLTSYANRELGRRAHTAFLAKQEKHGAGNPVLIVEDMHLSELNKLPKTIWVIPIRFEKADGSPVTVIVESE